VVAVHEESQVRQQGLGRAGVVAVVVTVLAWASAFVVIRFAAPWLSPGALTLGRLLVATVALTVMTSFRALGGGDRLVRLRALPRRERWLLVLIGLAWFGVYNVALNAGERHVDAGTASMIIQIGPVLIAVLAGTLLHEGFPRPLVVGTAVALLGTVMIGVATSTASTTERPTGASPVLGVLLVLVSAVVYAVALVAQKVVLRRLSGLLVTWAACSIGCVACLPFAGELVQGLAAAPARVWWGVVYLGVVPTAIAFSTWAYALGRSDAGRLSVSTYAVPPVAIAMGWLFLGEVPLPLAVAGGAVSLVGVAFSRRPAPVR
jgi:drug/metabolite transporter (DMT)-like permease